MSDTPDFYELQFLLKELARRYPAADRIALAMAIVRVRREMKGDEGPQWFLEQIEACMQKWGQPLANGPAPGGDKP